VEFEVQYVPHNIPISKACGLVWNCTDVLPSIAFDTLEWCGLEPKRRSYAAGARALHAAIRGEQSGA
jgi:hypothetical protein